MPDDQPSSYLQYLPTPYQGDAFLGRFLRIFESILGPIEQTIEGVANYFDPHLTPVETLPWLASWSAMILEEDWPIPAHQVVRRATRPVRVPTSPLVPPLRVPGPSAPASSAT